MRKCPECGANLDSGERCDCERERDREKLDRAIGMIKEAISTMRVADGLLRECGIVLCSTLDYDYDIMDAKFRWHLQILSGKEVFERITGKKWKKTPFANDIKLAATKYRGLKVVELKEEAESSGF